MNSSNGQQPIETTDFLSVFENNNDGPKDKYLTFTSEEANSTIGLVIDGKNSEMALPINLQYSTDDGKTWSDYTFDGINGTTITLTNIGDNVKFKGENSTFFHSGKGNDWNYKFTMTGTISASGDITSLLNNIGGNCDLVSEFTFCEMFSECTSLTTAPDLPATTLADYCYQSMFYNCTLLTTAPNLPATQLADYCYSYMFQGCESLTTAPALPATTLANNCYQSMFNGCSLLTEAPVLPATALTQYCYQSMFNGCSSLTTAPVLPAETLVSNCYNQMFNGCSNLSSITALFTGGTGDNYSREWVYGVSETGDFYYSPNIDQEWINNDKNRNADAIPKGWNINVYNQ